MNLADDVGLLRRSSDLKRITGSFLLTSSSFSRLEQR
jgi:hypothetical protein